MERTIASIQALLAEAPCFPLSVGCLARVKREGALDGGDRVATGRLGTCEVLTIESTHTLKVLALDYHTHCRISGIDFGPGVRLGKV